VVVDGGGEGKGGVTEGSGAVKEEDFDGLDLE
jgi:hypothetical protein